MAVKDWDAHPKCTKCGAEITFVKVQGKDGATRAHPVNIEKHPTIGIVLSSEKSYTGEPLYKYRRVYISHFATCPDAQSFRDKGKEKKHAGDKKDSNGTGSGSAPENKDRGTEEPSGSDTGSLL